MKANVKAVGFGCGLASLGLCFVAAALVFMVAAIYKALAHVIPEPFVLLILAGVCAIISAIILRMAKKYANKSS